jgi:hypothetical protein
MSSKLNIGSVIWNATTGVEQGNILHSNALKTINGTSLVGSGDTSVLNATLIGSASSDTTFTHNMAQYKLIVLVMSGIYESTEILPYAVKTYYIRNTDDILLSGEVTFDIVITATTLQIIYRVNTCTISVYGVK